jgi:hypothetical protein
MVVNMHVASPALIRTDDTALFGSDAMIEAASTDDVVVHFAEQARAARVGSDHGPSVADRVEVRR